MKSDSTTKIQEYIVKLKRNILNKEIPSHMNGKRVVPAQKKKIEEIKLAQVEPLDVVLRYIHTHIHGENPPKQ